VIYPHIVERGSEQKNVWRQGGGGSKPASIGKICDGLRTKIQSPQNPKTPLICVDMINVLLIYRRMDDSGSPSRYSGVWPSHSALLYVAADLT
jgi:hypothetical protein